MVVFKGESASVVIVVLPFGFDDAPRCLAKVDLGAQEKEAIFARLAIWETNCVFNTSRCCSIVFLNSITVHPHEECLQHATQSLP